MEDLEFLKTINNIPKDELVGLVLEQRILLKQYEKLYFDWKNERSRYEVSPRNDGH